MSCCGHDLWLNDKVRSDFQRYQSRGDQVWIYQAWKQGTKVKTSNLVILRDFGEYFEAKGHGIY